MDVVSSKEATDVVAGMGEALLDQQVSAGLLRDIPVVGSLVGVVRAVGAIRDGFFMRKLARFASELGEVSDEDRYQFRQQIETDPELRSDVGENLLLMIERMDDVQKAPLAGRIFAAFLRRRVDRSQMRRLLVGLDRAFYADIVSLVENRGQGVQDEEEWADALATAGFMQRAITPMYGGSMVSYTLTQTGRRFMEICFPNALQ